MAQACVVMVQRQMESAQQQCMLTPVPPMSPDASFITSSVRKRKEPLDGEAAGEKRIRIDATTAHQSNTTAAAAAPAAPAHTSQHHPDGVDDQAAEGDILFSPSFHYLDKDGGGEPVEKAPTRPGTPPGENTSTDASTGTSASLDQGDSEGAAVVVAVVPPTSPAPTATTTALVQQQQQQQQEGGDEEDDDDDTWEFDPYLFIKRLPALHHCILPRTSFLLPRQTRHSKKKTLVLDLDETLVHSTLDGECSPDFTFAVQMGPIRHMVAVRMRPHLHLFLNRVAELFEVVVFTASQQIYAEQLLDILDPGEKRIRHRIYRDSCVLWEGNYLKDLTVLGRDLAHTLIIDNSPQAFGFQLENGVPIESWYDDDQDTELLKLLPFLEEVAAASDVRTLIDQQYRLKDLVAAAMVPASVPAPQQQFMTRTS